MEHRLGDTPHRDGAPQRGGDPPYHRSRRLPRRDHAIRGHLQQRLGGQPGFVPMTERESAHMAAQLKPILRPELLVFAEVGGQAIGFALGLPDANQALRVAAGRTNPYSLWKMARAAHDPCRTTDRVRCPEGISRPRYPRPDVRPDVADEPRYGLPAARGVLDVGGQPHHQQHDARLGRSTLQDIPDLPASAATGYIGTGYPILWSMYRVARPGLIRPSRIGL